MKTEQEQRRAIRQILFDANDICQATPCENEYCIYRGDYRCYDNVIVDKLIRAGYGDVSEYKTEIERLRQEVRDTDKMARNTIEQYKNNYDNAFERLKAQEREIQSLREANIDLKEELYELHDELDIARAKKDKTIKQTQIDILNEVKKRLDSAPNGWAYTAYIDELIEEIEK